VVAGAAGAVLAGAGVVAFGIGARVVDRPVVERVALDPVASSPGVDQSAIEGVRQRVAPAVVALDAAPEAGSGVIVRDDGIVLTSAALVTSSGATVAVRMPDGSSVEAEVLGVDSTTGLGVLDLDGRGYTTGVLATASDMTAGQTSYTVAAGLAGGTTTLAGEVGAARRYETASARLDAVVEVTGDAGPLALGGALVDKRGAVIGIIAAVDTGTATYVAPVDVARKVTNDVLTTGYVRHSWLGIDGSDSTTATTTTSVRPLAGGSVAALGSTSGQPASGVEVATVEAGSPADVAGLEVGDVLVELGGRRIDDVPDLMLALRAHSPDDRVDVVVVRGGGETSIQVTLGDVPASAP
jgi:S1-C subfamily serine protease